MKKTDEWGGFWKLKLQIAIKLQTTFTRTCPNKQQQQYRLSNLLIM